MISYVTQEKIFEYWCLNRNIPWRTFFHSLWHLWYEETLFMSWQISAIKKVNDWALKEENYDYFLKNWFAHVRYIGRERKKIGENILFLMISSHVIIKMVQEVPEIHSCKSRDSKKGTIASMMSAGFAWSAFSSHRAFDPSRGIFLLHTVDRPPIS